MDRIMGLIVRWVVFISKYASFFSKKGGRSFERYEKGKPLKILLVGYNGARNTGADVRVAVIVQQLEKIFGKEKLEISVMTLDIDNFKVYFEPHIKLIKFNPIFFWDIFKACSCHHVAILCEGSTLKSKFSNALTLFFCEAAGIMKAQGKPCIAYGSEVGEMDRFVEKISIKMCQDTYFIARTQPSLDRIHELGLQGHLGSDTAWFFDSSMKQDWTQSKLKEVGWDGKQRILGVTAINPFWWPVKPSISKYLKAIFSGNWNYHFSRWYFFSWSKSRAEQLHTYLTSISKAVCRYAKKEDLFIVLIGMEKLDTDAIKILQKQFGKQVPMFLSKDYDGYELAQILRSLSMLITSRYHAQVLSMNGYVPSIGISMDERLDNLMKELEFGEKQLHDVGAIDLEQKVYRSLHYINENREQIQSQCRKNVPIYQQKLEDMEVFLEQYIWSALLDNE